jgi:hypothetical protein
VLKPATKGNGRQHLCLRLDGKTVTFDVHVLVAEAFLGPRPDGQEVCHIDGNPSNNQSCNLRYGTHRENEADKREHGTHGAGEQHSQAKLTVDEVAYIKSMYRFRHPEFGGKPLAIRFGISRAQVSHIVNGKQWKENQ